MYFLADDNTTILQHLPHIAEKIEEIRAKFDAEKAAVAVEEHLSASVTEVAHAPAPNPMMGHNRPPPDERLPVNQAEIDALAVHVRNVVQQMRAEVVDVQAVAEATAEIEKTERRIGAWFAEKLDVGAKKFFEEIGKWGGRVAVAGLTTGALWLFGLLERLGPLVEALRRVLAGLVG